MEIRRAVISAALCMSPCRSDFIIPVSGAWREVVEDSMSSYPGTMPENSFEIFS
jgi:hypothetical protein